MKHESFLPSHRVAAALLRVPETRRKEAVDDVFSTYDKPLEGEEHSILAIKEGNWATIGTLAGVAMISYISKQGMETYLSFADQDFLSRLWKTTVDAIAISTYAVVTAEYSLKFGHRLGHTWGLHKIKNEREKALLERLQNVPHD